MPLKAIVTPLPASRMPGHRSRPIWTPGNHPWGAAGSCDALAPGQACRKARAVVGTGGWLQSGFLCGLGSVSPSSFAHFPPLLQLLGGARASSLLSSAKAGKRSEGPLAWWSWLTRVLHGQGPPSSSLMLPAWGRGSLRSTPCSLCWGLYLARSWKERSIQEPCDPYLHVAPQLHLCSIQDPVPKLAL